MPTIEIVSIKREKRLKVPKDKYHFWVRQNLDLKSHRDLFQPHLDQFQGVILHLGNLDMKNFSPWFFGNELIDWEFELEDENRFKFKPKHFIGIQSLVKRTLLGSPEGKVFFLTDIQGSENGNIVTNYTVNQFIKEHEISGLEWNTLYEITIKD